MADTPKKTAAKRTPKPKPVGKGKIIVKKQAKIEYDTILEAKVVIKF